jgi:hypothetical protein
MPAAAASLSAASVPACGTIMNARSTGSGIWVHEVTVGRPCAGAPRRVTRWVCSPRPNSIRLRKVTWENPDLSAAPTSATLRGRSSAPSRCAVIVTVTYSRY